MPNRFGLILGMTTKGVSAPAPTLSAVSPTIGDTAIAANTITLTGTNLTGATSVKIGVTACTSVTVVGPTSVTAVTPAKTIGLYDVSVTTPGGTATLTNAYRAWDPPAAFTTGLKYEYLSWLGVSGTTWSDQSGNANNATAADAGHMPAASGTDPAGHATLISDGSNDYMTVGTNVTSTAQTLVLVARRIGTANADKLWQSTNDVTWYSSNSTDGGMTGVYLDAMKLSNQYVGHINLLVYAVRANNYDSVDFYCQGTKYQTVTTGSAWANNGASVLFGSSTASTCTNAQVAVAMAIDGAVSDANMTILHQWISWKTGVLYASTAAGQTLVGASSLETNVDYNTPGTAQATKFIAPLAGTPAAIKFYLDASYTASKVVVGIYADNGSGYPGTLVTNGQVTVTGGTAGAWNTATLTSCAALTAGKVYWLALLQPLTSTGVAYFRDNSTGAAGTSSYTFGTTLETLPATATAGGSGWLATIMSEYVIS
jgi:large repetitive protein